MYIQAQTQRTYLIDSEAIIAKYHNNFNSRVQSIPSKVYVTQTVTKTLIGD
jgi:hypothetical protein